MKKNQMVKKMTKTLRCLLGSHDWHTGLLNGSEARFCKRMGCAEVQIKLIGSNGIEYWDYTDLQGIMIFNNPNINK